MKPTVYLGSDHGGFRLKERLKERLGEWGYPFEDLGDARLDPHDDYPIYGLLVAARVASDQRRGKPAVGILGCRSAAGMVMAAGKVPGIRAAAGFDRRSAVHSRIDNDANVLALPGDYLNHRQVAAVAKAWLETTASRAGRHVRRLDQLARTESTAVAVIPGVLEATAAETNRTAGPLAAASEWIHVDVADGVLVPNTALPEPADARAVKIDAVSEAHLMVERPERYVSAWIRTGARRLIAHVEAADPAAFLRAVKAAKARTPKLEGWLAVDEPTSVSKLTRYLGRVDGVTVMAVPAGFSGQSFHPAVLAKITKLKQLKPNLPVEVDGGVNETTAPAARAAGADRLVSSAYLRRQRDIPAAIRRLAGRV